MNKHFSRESKMMLLLPIILLALGLIGVKVIPTLKQYLAEDDCSQNAVHAAADQGCSSASTPASKN
ncbi:hypothetical protein HCH_01995 [Hahella chejuensis KCTC 2396]|uniref:Uncharacterized protein n=1 Tax=Hahella chejuensis (strain KCTC 2396) TaxID=349521 RepID=Q2SKJ5_HAHCH|nr:hypothetical protein [Hahella chejuensis]ABC28829.1 hypothetical protein HCH_01995 [Hahella chejuensis KCTC 2396]